MNFPVHGMGPHLSPAGHLPGEHLLRSRPQRGTRENEVFHLESAFATFSRFACFSNFDLHARRTNVPSKGASHQLHQLRCSVTVGDRWRGQTQSRVEGRCPPPPSTRGPPRLLSRALTNTHSSSSPAVRSGPGCCALNPGLSPGTMREDSTVYATARQCAAGWRSSN